MAKLIILRGLPASGKSTKAEELIRASGNMVRVNRDLLREMLHFNKWTGANESITKAMAQMIARECLRDNINVIIDDTNLHYGTFKSWENLAKELRQNVEVIDISTDYKECIRRDLIRECKGERSVGENVIFGMAMANCQYPTPEKGIVICDIDGTLADLKHRRKYVLEEKKDWAKFFSLMGRDKVRDDVAGEVLKYEGEGYEIFLVSGRPENYREKTEAWLEKKFKGYRFYKTLFMRRADDKRDDVEVKKDIYEKFFKQFKIHKVFDDRPRVIRMWKEQGLDVVDVGDGVEF